MTLVLAERDVEGLVEMKEVVSCVEEAFRQQGMGEVSNSKRTRSRGSASVLSVMHANLPYLGRAGLKAYLASRMGTKFALLLFDTKDSRLLAVMGADVIGRFRTGAASGVATKYMYGKRAGTLTVLGSGKQALTQVLAIQEIMTPEEVRVWSPTPEHRVAFVRKLKTCGFNSRAFDSPTTALKGAEVATAITSSGKPFLTDEMLGNVMHLNIAGGNVSDRAEVTADGVGAFDTVAVDDIAQAKVEYGDLIQAVKKGVFSWKSAVELGTIVAGKVKPEGRTLFKSGGVALEDVAVASMVYDRATRSSRAYPNVELN
ncbi:MAG TPA: ornithine cyclodeaminase family protein [Nitrososphaerales archaeon]|nr:ornithine cyclodeaminase family protein [Nitrososphaerales archaeon]